MLKSDMHEFVFRSGIRSTMPLVWRAVYKMRNRFGVLHVMVKTVLWRSSCSKTGCYSSHRIGAKMI